MDIKLKYFGFFENLAGRKEESLGFTRDVLRVRDVITYLSEKHGTPFRNTLMNPDTNQIREGCVLLLNDIKGCLDDEIENGDVISLLPVLAGG
jgi:molybdopterin converting factor small subunit